MKKIFSIILILSFISITFFTPGMMHKVNAADDIKVKINGELQNFPQPPVIIQSTTMVPMRAIFEALGATITWNNDEKSVTATKGNIDIYIKLGEETAFVNGQPLPLIVPAQLVNGSTMVPVRFVSEALGAEVGWEGSTKTVLINLKEMSAARRLLEEGLAEEGMTIDDFTFELLTGDATLAEGLGNLIIDAWKEQFGIDVSMKNVPFATRLDLSAKQKFDVVISGWGPDYNDPLTELEIFTTNNQYNDGKWSNIKYDSLINLAKKEMDQEKRLNYFLEAEKILIQDEHAIAPLYFRNHGYLKRPFVDGLIVQEDGIPLELKWASVDIDKANRDHQELNLALSYTPDLDALYSADKESWIVINAIQEGLVRNGPNGIVPAVAESWDISKDGTTYTFKLRKNAKWSNGKPVTAQDFVYGWERVINASNNSDLYKYIVDYIKGAGNYYNYTAYAYFTDIYNEYPDAYEQLFTRDGVLVTPSELVYGKKIENVQPVTLDNVGFKAIDDHTFEVELIKPTPWFMDLLTYPVFTPLNQEFYEANKDDYATSADTILYNGPWVVSEWEDNLSLTRNSYYWDKFHIPLSSINFEVLWGSNLLYLYDQGLYDFVLLDDYFPKNYKDNPDYHSYPAMSTFYIDFNTTRKPFNNVKVRKALSMSINRQEIVDTIFDGLYDPAYGMVPTGFRSYATATTTFREESEKKFGRLFEEFQTK